MRIKKGILFLLLAFGLSGVTYAQLGTASVTYTAGDLETYKYFWSPSHTSPCPGLMTVTIPANALILSTDVSYDMTSDANSGIYKQRSQLRCVSTGGINEPTVTNGPSLYTPGTHSYSRTGLDIANGITTGGDINFELHAGATHYQQVCNTDFAVVDNNTWTITVTYIPTGYPMQAENPTPANDEYYIGLDDDISWDFGSDTETYDVYFGTDNPPTTMVVNNVVAGTTGTYDPGTMDETQTYYWQVVSRNANGYTSGQVWSFTTVCGMYSTPFTEGFEDVTGPDLPYCWTNIVNSTSSSAKVETYNYYGYNSQSALKMTNGNDAEATLIFISPKIDVGTGTLADKMVNLYIGQGSEFPSLVVGTMSDPSDESTFTAYESFYAMQEYVEYDIYLNDYTGTDTYIAFKLDVNKSYQNAQLDDITIKDMPTCIRPEDLSADNLTINTASVNWTDLNEATSWNIEYGIAGFTPTGTPTVTGVSNPSVLTGLTSATDYEFYVQTDCGGGDVSAWSQMGSFSTPCDFFPVPFSEDFEGLGFGELPGCWSNILLTTDAWTMNGTNGGTFQMEIQSDTNSTLMLISPPIENLSLNRIRFFAKSSKAGYNLVIGTITNPADKNTFDSLTSVKVTTANAFEEFDVWLNGTTGNDNYFAIMHSNETTSLRFNIDDVSIEELPSCLPPVDLFVDNITNVSADFNWTESGSATDWVIEVGALGFEAGTGNHISQYNYNNTNPTDLSYILSGLSSATTYDVYIRTDCGDGDMSPWTGPVTFLSGFDAFGELPVSEDFETGMGKTDNYYQNVQDWVINTDLQHSGLNSIHNAYNINDDNVLFMLGTFDFTTNTDIVLTFWHIAKTDGRSDHSYVEISTDGGLTFDQLPESTYAGSGRYREDDLYAPFDGPCFDEDSYTEWGTANTVPDNSMWKKEYFNLSGYNSYDNVVLRFRLASNGYTNRNGWYIDDIAIETSGSPEFYIDPVSITEPLDPTSPVVNVDMVMGNTGGFPAGYTASIFFDETALLNEDFNSGIPSDWTIVSRGTNGVTWTDTESIYNRTIDGTSMVWCDGTQGNLIPVTNVMDEELITPVINAAVYSNGILQLEYDQVFDADYQPGDTARVYVYDGTSWVMIYEKWLDDGSIYSGGVHKVWDVTAYANENFQIKFHYIEGSTTRRGRYFTIDNVKLRGSLSQLDWLTLDGSTSVSGVALPDTDGIISLADVKLDATNLAVGTYEAEIKVVSNDPNNLVTIVPVVYWSELAGADPFASPDEVCNGSNTQLYANLTGGTGSQVYSWTSMPTGFTSDEANPVVSPTEATTYYVQVTDGALSASGEVTVNVNPVTAVSIGSFNGVCIDKPILVLKGGFPEGGVYSGTGVEDGVFYPSVAGVGTHTITYTYTNEFGCDNAASTSINVAPLPYVTLEAFNDVCNDEIFELTGGSPVGGAYSGAGVNNGMFNPVVAGVGTHTIVYTYVNASGCENTAEETITVYPPFTVNAGTYDDVCIDAGAFELTGGTPEGGVYSGNAVVNGIFYTAAAGTGVHSISYTYTNEFGCAQIDYTTISVIDIPEVAMEDDMACIQWSEFELTGGTPEGGEYSGPGVMNGMFDPEVAGMGSHTITYTYTNETGCENYAEGTMLVDNCTGIGEFSENLNIQLAPNPNNGLFSLSMSTASTEEVEVRVFNFTGHMVFEEKSVPTNNKHSVEIDLTNQPKGMYFVHVLTNENRYTEKVIIR